MELLSYSTYGDENNPPLVLVHGVGGSTSIFFRQIQRYKKHFYVIGIDLPGHGKTYRLAEKEDITFEKAAKSIIHLLDHLQIKSALFVGVSLGTVIIHKIIEIAPDRVEKAVLGGAITSVDLPSKWLLKLGGVLKDIMPYMWLYQLCAVIIMPKRNHRDSRNLFIKEAKKMGDGQFVKWYRLTAVVNGVYDKTKDKDVPKLYITGEQDHFLYRIVKRDVCDDENATFYSIPKCGHVCNLDQHRLFNEASIAFLLEEKIEAVKCAE